MKNYSIESKYSIETIVDAAYSLYMPQIRSEIVTLANIVDSHRPRKILEIGTKYGGTAFIWNSLLYAYTFPTQFVSIDLPSGNFGGVSEEMVKYRDAMFNLLFGGQPEVHTNIFIHADSKSVCNADLYRGDVRPFDFVFIDGCHTYTGVKSDLYLVMDNVRSGSIIAFHDIVDSSEHRDRGVEVCDFWNEIKYDDRFNFMEIVESRKQTWAGIGVLFVK